MPPTPRKTGQDLDIEVDGKNECPFRPGDTITGRITRRAHIVSPMSTVEVQLVGRAKVKLGKTRYNGQSSYTTYYRGRFNFFGNETRQHLFHGPVHVPQGGPGRSWEFAIQIPLHATPEVLLGGHTDPHSSYLPLNISTVESTPLPSIFYDKGHALNTKYETYVEYFLEASLVQQGSHGASYTATFLIPIRALSPPHETGHSATRKNSQNGRVVSQRLVPGMEDSPLSFKQKTQKLFHSSKVPSLGLVLDVVCPEGIRLGARVPLQVKIRPNRQSTSEVIRDVPQTVLLTDLELVLKARTHVIAPGTWHPYEADDDVKHHIVLPRVCPPLTSPSPSTSGPSANDEDVLPAYRENDTLSVPSEILPASPAYDAISPHPRSPQDEAGPSSDGKDPNAPKNLHGLVFTEMRWDTKESGPFDIGELFDLRIYSKYAMALGKQISGGGPSAIFPSFTTWCIKHNHILGYKIKFTIAGELVKFEGQMPVVVVAPAEI